MINVDVSEIIGLGKAFDELSESVLDANVRQGAFIAGAGIQSAARALVPVDTSALKLSIDNDTDTTSEGLLISVGPTQPYGLQIEEGRPAGSDVTAAQLMGWAKRKGLNPYAVAASIRAKGSPAQPYLGPAFEAKQAGIVTIFSQSIVNAFAQVFKS